MPVWRIEFSRPAARQFAALPRKEQERLRARIDRLAENPCPAGVRKLAGEEGLYRLRSGDYRVIYTVQDEVLMVLVLKVGHRREVYR
jgi:mRNA interferase RelE/StbE